MLIQNLSVLCVYNQPQIVHQYFAVSLKQNPVGEMSKEGGSLSIIVSSEGLNSSS